MKKRADEIIKNGKVVFERHTDYTNQITGKVLHEHLRHIRYKGVTWDVTFISGKLYSLFALDN